MLSDQTIGQLKSYCEVIDSPAEFGADSVDRAKVTLALIEDHARLEFLMDEQAFVQQVCARFFLVYPLDGAKQIGDYETPRQAIDAAIEAARSGL